MSGDHTTRPREQSTPAAGELQRLRASIDLAPPDHTESHQPGDEWDHVGPLDIENTAPLTLGDAGAGLHQHEHGHSRVPQAERCEPLIELGERVGRGALQKVTAKRDQRVFHARRAVVGLAAWDYTAI